MIRRLTLLIVAVCMLAPAASAGKKKTVEINDNTITDSAYGWVMTFPDNWKARSLNEPNLERVYLIKKNYSVNQYIQTYGGDYTIPTFSIFVQEFSGDITEYEALLLKSLDEHRSDTELISKLGLLTDCDYITSGNVVIDSSQARQIYVKRNYKRLLDVNGEPKYINDHEVHEIYLVKKDNLMYVIQAFCEREFYETNHEEFAKLIMSINL
jgi:hypothetical protein